MADKIPHVIIDKVSHKKLKIMKVMLDMNTLGEVIQLLLEEKEELDRLRAIDEMH